MPALQRTGKEFTDIYCRNADAVYRICYSFMKTKADTEDMVQETFLRLLSSNKEFENPRHEKAWLIVTASNLCKDSLKKWWRRNESLEDHPSLESPQETSEVLDAILRLKPDYKTVIYMYYYEGYTTEEIAAHLRCPNATVRSRLSRGRNQLKQLLEE